MSFFKPSTDWLASWLETQRPLPAVGRPSPPVVKSDDWHPETGSVRCLQRMKPISLCPNLSLFFSGVCKCSDFTAGKACERCLEGYHGNALTGTPEDCQPCPCPNQSSCARIESSGQVVCTDCPRGQTGESITAHLTARYVRICIQAERSTHQARKVNVRLPRLAAEEGSQESPR